MTTEPLESTPEVATRVGRAGKDDHLFFGLRHFVDLPGRQSFTGLVAIAVGGRPLSAEDCGVLDDIAAVTTFGDPRIWPLKVVRLVASYGHALPAWACGVLVLENELLGPWTMIDTAANVSAVAHGLSRSEEDARRVARELLARKRRLLGFGVPFRPVDERLSALRACLERRGRVGLPHWRASELLAETVLSERGLQPNVGLGVAAACLDLGFAPSEVPAVGTVLAQHLHLATALEGAQQQPAVLRQLPSSCVRYVGQPARQSWSRQPAPGPASSAPAAASCRHARVLVVDDDSLVGNALGRLLGGFDVGVVTSATEALRRIEAGDRFDAIVCDLLMPGLTGMALFERLSGTWPEQARRMVFLTGDTTSDMASAFLSAIPNPHLEKPVDPVALVGLVERIVS